MHGVWAIENLAWDQYQLTRGRLAAMGVREVVGDDALLGGCYGV